MTGIASLLAVADAYGSACAISQTTVSKRALQDSSRLAELRAGSCDIGVKRLARTLQWFADNWPPEAHDTWPADVSRPAKTPTSANTDPAPQAEGAAA